MPFLIFLNKLTNINLLQLLLRINVIINRDNPILVILSNIPILIDLKRKFSTLIHPPNIILINISTSITLDWILILITINLSITFIDLIISIQ
jgi:hypothetical protein